MKRHKNDQTMRIGVVPNTLERTEHIIQNQVAPIVEINDPFPNRPLRVSEVAAYYDVTERSGYLWIEHGHLKTEYTPAGQMRVTKDSLNSCRFLRRNTENDI